MEAESQKSSISRLDIHKILQHKKITKMKSHGTTKAMKGTQKFEATVFNPSWNLHASPFTSFTTLDVFTVAAKASQVLKSK